MTQFNSIRRSFLYRLRAFIKLLPV